MQLADQDWALVEQIFYYAASAAIVFAFAKLFLLVFETKLDKQFKKRMTRIGRTCVYGAIFVLVIISLTMQNQVAPWVWYVLEGLVLFAYSVAFCRGKLLHKIFWLFILVVFFFVGQLAGGLLALLLFEQPGFFLSAGYAPLVERVVALVVFGLMCLLLIRQKRRSTEMSSLAILMLSLVPALSCFVLYVWAYEGATGAYELSFNNFNQTAIELNLAVVLAIAVINMVVFVLYDYMLVKGEERLEQQAQLMHAQIAQTHYEELQSLYRETRGWRHDWGNHLQAMEGLLLSENYEGLNKLVTELKGSTNKINFRINSGNELLDAILQAKLTHAEEAGIPFKIDIATNLDDLSFSIVDTTSLIGNLVDNAIEACERIEDKKATRAIELYIKKVDSQLLIYLKNSTNGKIELDENGVFKTSKKDGDHGIGTQQINAIVKKYQGTVDYTIEKNIFETSIMLRA